MFFTKNLVLYSRCRTKKCLFLPRGHPGPEIFSAVLRKAQVPGKGRLRRHRQGPEGETRRHGPSVAVAGGCRVTVGGRSKFACVDGPEFDGHQVDYDELMLRLQAYCEDEQKCYHEFCVFEEK